VLPRLLLTTIAAFLMLAPAASAAELWDGVWNTKNKFGSPRLNLTQDGRDLYGKYRDDGGAVKGKIQGELSDHKTVWKGTYRDNDGSDSGKFRVELQGDRTSFEGWFKSCGTFTCSEKYNWTGQSASQ
jgi:hypothetical protein